MAVEDAGDDCKFSRTSTHDFNYLLLTQESHNRYNYAALQVMYQESSMISYAIR
jgi:hypothetical protein